MCVLELKDINFSYGRKKVLCDINLKLDQGVIALMGPNGAGKTTMINIIMGLFLTEKGSVLFQGKEIKKMGDDYYNYVGYMPQMPEFYKNFTAKQFLEYMASIKEMKKSAAKDRINELLDLVNLSDKAAEKIGTFSGGMKQRLGIAQALLNDPQILILDEPTAGLDPKERIRFKNVISQIAADRIIIFATHIVPDVESIAKHIVVLNEGKIVLDATARESIERMKDYVWTTRVSTLEEVEEFQKQYLVSNVKEQSDGGYEIRIISKKSDCENLLHASPTLEDAFLYLCKGEV